MGRYDGTCALCSARIRTGATVCRNCYLTRRPLPRCANCGAQLTAHRSKLCRDCWHLANPGPGTCETCGTRLGAGARHATRQCQACRSAHARPQCQDCGELMPRASRGRRCWNCHLTRRQSLAGQKRCLRPGCDQPHQAKGYCLRHYQYYVGRKKAGGLARWLVKQEPCAVCGYARMPSEPHRIIPGGPYEIGNMVPVCARCHDEVERGLTPCPPAWQPAELHMG